MAAAPRSGGGWRQLFWFAVAFTGLPVGAFVAILIFLCWAAMPRAKKPPAKAELQQASLCLLYTSDAADE